MTSLAFGGLYGWTTWWVIGGFVLFLVLMPIFVWVESPRPDADPRPVAASATACS